MTTRPLLSAVPWRERVFVLTGLAGTTVLAWAYLFVLASGMDMAGGMGGGAGLGGPHLAPWSTVDWVLTALMWAIMMVGMMLPSATPTILLYATVRRKQGAKGHDIAPTSAFAAGYLAAWGGFSVAATVLQWSLERLALMTPMMATTSATLGGLILVAAGVYQLSPLKNRCLEHCRAPVEFLARHWRRGPVGAVGMGLHHGFYCVGCCWGLMALLFVGGVMNLLWVAAIAAFVLVEKVAPFAGVVRAASAMLLIAWGLYTLA